MRPVCPSFEALSRSVSGPVSRRVAAHVEACADCRRTWDALIALDEAARRLPVEAPDPDVARRMEAALVALAPEKAVGPRRATMPRYFAWGSAVAAAIALVIAIAPSHQRDPLRRFEASADARYERVTRHPTDGDDSTLELVRLSMGTVALQVEHLGPKERVVVATADAEVEVRGTRFEVDADEGKLRAVAVHEGKVEVRVAGRRPVLLLPGDRWTSAEAAPDASPVASRADASAAIEPRAEPPIGAPFVAATTMDPPRVAPKRSHPRALAPAAPNPLEPTSPAAPDEAPRQPAPARASFPAEEAFASGWAALRDGAPADAAKSFAAAAASAEGDLSRDAAYWEVVSLARAGDATAAESRMERFLERHRGSERAGEVALMLGLRLAARGDRHGAATHLRAAAIDPSEAVRQRAKQALDRLGASDPDDPR